jgi:hypothetical protein
MARAKAPSVQDTITAFVDQIAAAPTPDAIRELLWHWPRPMTEAWRAVSTTATVLDDALVLAMLSYHENNLATAPGLTPPLVHKVEAWCMARLCNTADKADREYAAMIMRQLVRADRIADRASTIARLLDVTAPAKPVRARTERHTQAALLVTAFPELSSDQLLRVHGALNGGENDVRRALFDHPVMTPEILAECLATMAYDSNDQVTRVLSAQASYRRHPAVRPAARRIAARHAGLAIAMCADALSEDCAAIFRELASTPQRAMQALAANMTGIAAHLTAADLTPLLESTDGHVRTCAIQAVALLGNAPEIRGQVPPASPRLP